MKSEVPDEAGIYENCLYACRLCNTARGKKALETPKARLLDPTKDPWNRHFEVVGPSLLPKAGDADAQYTFEAYDLDSESKRSRRQARLELLEDRLELLTQIEEELASLLELVQGIDQGSEEFFEVWQEISDIRRQALRAQSDLDRYRVVPRDAPADCRCQPPQDLTLPKYLLDQCPRVG